MAWRNELLSTLMLYKYDNTIFDNMIVPNGVDKDTVVDAILLDTAELSTLYSSPESLKNMITLWSRRQFHIWEELYLTTQYVYNPIENYDRHETEHIEDKENTNLTRDLEDVTNATTTGDYSGHEDHKIAAFNNGLANSTQTDSNGTSTNKEDRSYKQEGSEDTAFTTDDWRRNYTHGNIGVTTTQEMIQQQRDVVQFNIIDYIVCDYKKHFCIMVY